MPLVLDHEATYWHGRVTALEDVVLALGMQGRLVEHHKEWLKKED